jgi:RNA polymerase sigma-70 factor, ECF subfamily
MRVMTKNELQDIINGCRLGSRLSQMQLYRLFYRYGMNICNRYARSEEEAEEMLNDAFLRIFTKIALYDTTLSFPAWLHTIVVRSAINYLKKYQNFIATSDIEIVESYTTFNENIMALLSAEEIIGLVKRLPPSYRAAFNLSVVEGYAHAEIAALLGISEGTVRSNLMIARQKLQDMVLQSNKIKI